jgi:tRNA(Ile)-lysidine synthase
MAGGVGGAPDLRARVETGGLIDPPRSLVAMLSGGRDSVCMLDLAVRARDRHQVLALHVNYGLRDDAEADERHCAELCAALGVELSVRQPRRAEGGGNLQAWAREQRYDAAHRIAGPGLDARIATGHTADDQVETILYRLASSPSRRALLGMRPADGRLVRPLLATTRAETTAYCVERGLAWREDPSNEDAAFARNRIRHGLVPEFERVHPAAQENLLRTAAVLDELVEAELRGGGEVRPGTIAVSRYRELSPALRRLVLQRLADLALGRPLAGAARFAEQVAGLRPSGGARLDLGGGVRAVVERGVLRAERDG